VPAANHKLCLVAVVLLTSLQPLAAHKHLAYNSRLGLDTLKTSRRQKIELASSLKPLVIDADEFQTCVRSQSTGKVPDAETGLDYFGARYLSAAQRRFTSPDKPLIDEPREPPQNWDPHGYVPHNPLRCIEPTGQACIVRSNGPEYGDDRGGQSCTELSHITP
jgi:RHS repeat-associated protein